MRSEYMDLKKKSNWLVKLVREETEKNRKLAEEMNNLKAKSEAMEKVSELSMPAPEKGSDKEKEFFIGIYEDHLKKIFVDERKIPSDYESMKRLYLNLKQHSQLMAHQLRDMIDKTYELTDEISKLKNR